MKRVAGPRRAAAADPYADAALVVAIVGDQGGGYRVQVDNRLGMPIEEVGALISEAVDRITGRSDRTRGLF